MAKTHEQAIQGLRDHLASHAAADGFSLQDDAAMWELRENTAHFDATDAGVPSSVIDAILGPTLHVHPREPIMCFVQAQ